MLIYVISATNYLFISSAGVHLTKFSPIFASFQQKCLENFFFVALGDSPAPPGYACGSTEHNTSRHNNNHYYNTAAADAADDDDAAAVMMLNV